MDRPVSAERVLDPDAPCQGVTPLVLSPMVAKDTPIVAALERACFSSAWEPSAFLNELSNPAAVYYVARCCGGIVGFAGMWVAMDEAHFTLVGVVRGHRGQGIGTLLVIELLDEAVRRGATRATLEVRELNFAAQRLYLRLGFESVGKRPRYYTDTDEDALIMWAEKIHLPDAVERRRAIRESAEATRTCRSSLSARSEADA